VLVPTVTFGFYLLVAAAAGMLAVAGCRYFNLTAGWTGQAIAAAVIAVAAGGALGGFLAGCAVSQSRFPVARLGALTAAFGAAALISAYLHDAVRTVYVASWPTLGGTAAGGFALRFLLALSLFALPAALFFATPPFLARAIVAREEGAGVSVGFGMGLTLAGAGLGVLTAPSLIGLLGLRGSVLFGAACAGMGAAGLVLLKERGLEGPGVIGRLLAGERGLETAAADREQGGVLSVTSAGLLGAAASLFAFAAWTSFIVWQRTLGFVLGPTLPGRSAAAALFLLSLALGSFVSAGLADRVRRPMPVLVTLLAAGAVAVYASMHLIEQAAGLYLRLSPLLARPGLSLLPPAAAALLVVFPAGVLIGAVLPLVPQTARSRGRTMAGIAVYLGIGTVLAELTVSQAIIPAFGLRRAASLGCAVALLSAILFLGFIRFANPAMRATVTMVLLGLMIALGLVAASWDPRVVASAPYRYGARSLERFGSAADYFAGRRRIDLLFYREGPDATVTVERSLQAASGAGDALALTVDGKVEATTGPDLRTQVLQAHIPIFARGPADDVLLVDFLDGVTAGSILRHPVKSLTVVEREPAVLEAAAAFAAYNQSPLTDARVRVVHDTARSRLLVDRAAYDVIILSTLEPWLPHGSALLTAEGWGVVKSRLKQGGVVAQRVSLTAAPEPALRTVLRTFARAFPSVLVFQVSGEDLLLVGSEQPLALDVGWMKNVIGSRGEVADDLRRILVLGPNEILLNYRLDAGGLAQVAGQGPVDADDRSLVEAATLRAMRPQTNEAILAEVDAAWKPLTPLLANYGAVPDEKADFLYGLAKSYLGFANDAKRARDVAAELGGLGRTAMARWVTGECLFQERDIDGALAEWKAVLAVEPGNLDALFSLGTFHLDSRDYWEADPYLARAARLHPDTAVVRYHYGRNLFYLGRNDGAIRELREAVRLAAGRESYPLVPYLVGVAEHKLKRHKEAAESLEAYLKWAYTQPLTRVEVDAHLKLADVYEEQGKRFQAHRERQKADDLRKRIEAQAAQRGVEAVAPPVRRPGATLDDSGVVGPADEPPPPGPVPGSHAPAPDPSRP
jgi:Tfp pilus assembly protein PilF